MVKKASAYIGLSLLLLLGGCAQKNVITNEQTLVTEKTEQTKLKKTSKNPVDLNTWVLSGAMSAKNEKKAWSASVDWQQDGANQYKIRLFGPLGGGAVMIEKQGTMVTYKDGPKVASSKNPDQLLSQQTGVRLPVKNLYYWVRGLAAPTPIQNIQHDTQHNISTLKQDGYHVEYIRYMKVNELYLPNQIRLSGHGINVRFIIKHWHIS